uniref:Sulfhydryl oxidase n=1 Tax=Marseillevirus LCMAC102 TaxID=2506603 RepID=A0A481YTW3_9VIRU|nr:MAG: Erv1/Alr family disulfide (thiol) oxidoreductase [Marseillevirus LCMAC102]
MKKGKDFWGPPVWTTIHIFAAILENAQLFEEFLWLLTKLLPCDYCKLNLDKKLETHPPKKYLVNNVNAFLYTYIVHDLANQHITKYHPSTPKTSPTFDDVWDVYITALHSQESNGFWGPPIWAVIHIFAATLRQENAKEYKRFLEVVGVLLPTQSSRVLLQILRSYPIDSYLRNNHDAFFYSYIIHDIMNNHLGKRSPSFDDVKSFYFSALGEECSDCKI